MTTPAPQPASTPGAWPPHRVLLVTGAVLFLIAAFAAGGDTLGGIGAWTWGFAGFAAWVLSGAVP